MSEILLNVVRMILLTGLVVCAVATAFSKRLLTSMIIFTAYSIIMSVIWILLESPDLAITEAAVGAGVTGILFFLTLRRLRRIDKDQSTDKGVEHMDDTPDTDEEVSQDEN